MTLPKFDHPWVDETYSPVMVCHGLAKPTDAELSEYLSRLEAWTHAAREPYSWIVRPGQLSPSQRKLMAETQIRLVPLMKVHQVALAFVVVNPVIKGVLHAVFWFSPPAVSYKICASFQEAFAFVAQAHPAAQVMERGIVSRVRAY